MGNPKPKCECDLKMRKVMKHFNNLRLLYEDISNKLINYTLDSEVAKGKAIAYSMAKDLVYFYMYGHENELKNPVTDEDLE